ncbi:hypothetical protein [Leptolyngbya sp. PCC 6406]|uniref:hypothetical protein n=1 Tax=Leptolyngbya sp. PCC 6406 TaxID=1173264 RepID=UPI0002AC6C15|nr:hypothetical protein [Leptolyngbya sp. PCC 6406]
MRKSRKTIKFLSLLLLAFAITTATVYRPRISHAQANFETCPLQSQGAVDGLELIAQVQNEGRHFSLFNVIDGHTTSHAIQSIRSDSQCELEYWNPTGQDIRITATDTLPSSVAQALLVALYQSIIDDIGRDQFEAELRDSIEQWGTDYLSEEEVGALQEIGFTLF